MTDDDDPSDDTGVAFVVPALGESVTETVLAEWLVAPGAFVVAEQPLVIIEADKMSIELTAPAAGVVVREAALLDTLKIGDVIARITPPPAHESSREQRHAELLAAVAAAPADIAARQVYADFLLEADGPIYPWDTESVRSRGEYLNVVARLAQPRAGDDLAALHARCTELEPCGHATARALVPIGGDTVIEDGFIVKLSTTVADFAAAHALVFARAPLTALAIRGFESDTDAARLLAIPRLEQLRTLGLIGSDAAQALPGDTIATILRSPRFAELERVELHDQALVAAAGSAIAVMPARSLALERCGLRPGFVAAIGERGFDRLLLDLHTWPPDDVARMLARPLRELVLHGNQLPPLPDVEELGLRDFEITRAWRAPASVRSLSLSCSFPSLRSLIDVIANQPNLVSLALVRTWVGDQPASERADEIRAALGGITLTF